jgi:hypothetical protein
VALAPRQPVLTLWDAGVAGTAGAVVSTTGGGGSGGAAPLEVRLSQLSFGAPTDEAAPWGVSSGSLVGITARRYTLPAGPKRIRLSLGKAQVAVLASGDTVLSAHWQGGQPFEELLDDDAGSLLLLHSGAGSDPFTFEILPRTGTLPELALDAAAPFVRTFDRAGTLRLRLPPGSPRTYRVWTAAAADHAGGLAQALLLDGDGGVSRARPVATGSAVAEMSGAGGGWLLVEHDRGAVLVWTAGLLESAAGGPTLGGAWQAPLGGAAVAVTPPGTTVLSGRFTHLAITASQPVVLHVRAATPALTLLRRAGSGTAGGNGAAGGATDEAVQVHPDGVNLDAYLLPGVSQLGLSALGEGELGGVATLTTTPVLAAVEGLGPEVMLPAGGARYFSFHVASRRPVGWGAAAAAEQVSCRLLRGDGTAVETQPLGAGKPAALADLLQMAELEPGDYLLALTSPPDAAPLRVRPVVVGLELPDTGPPPEVIRQYMQDAGAVATAAVPGSHP